MADDDKTAIRTEWEEAKKESAQIGGWSVFRAGEWLLPLIRKSFRNYWERGTAVYFQHKYGTTDPETGPAATKG